MPKSRLDDPGKLKQLIKIFNLVPHMCVPMPWNWPTYSNKEVSDLTFWRLLQHALPSGSIQGFRVLFAGDVSMLPPPPDCSEQRQKRAINNNIESTPSDDPPTNALEWHLHQQ